MLKIVSWMDWLRIAVQQLTELFAPEAIFLKRIPFALKPDEKPSY